MESLGGRAKRRVVRCGSWSAAWPTGKPQQSYIAASPSRRGRRAGPTSQEKIEESSAWTKKSTCQGGKALLFFWRRADVTALHGAARSTSCFVKELCNGREEDRQEDRCQGDCQEGLRHQDRREEGQGLSAAGTRGAWLAASRVARRLGAPLPRAEQDAQSAASATRKPTVAAGCQVGSLQREAEWQW